MIGGERGRHDPPRRPRRLLRVGGAAGRPAAARPAGDRRRRGGAGGQLRGAGVRRLRRDGRGPGAPAVSARDRRPATHGGLLGGEQGGVRGVRRHDATRRGAVDRRGVPRRRRAATGVRHAGADRPCSCDRTCGSGSACRSPSGWRGRSSSPRWRAASPNPTVCSSFRSAGELAFLHPLPVERLWGVGPATAGKLHARGITTVADVARLPHGALVSMLGRASGHQLHALAHNRDPRLVEARRRRRSIGSQRALGRRPTAAGCDRRRRGRPRRPGDSQDAHRRADRADGDAAAALRRLLAGDAVAHDALADGGDPGSTRARPEPCWRRRLRWSSSAASRWSGSRSPTSTTTARSSSPCRSNDRAARSTPSSTPCASASAPAPSRGPCCSATTVHPRCRCCRTDRPGARDHGLTACVVELSPS